MKRKEEEEKKDIAADKPNHDTNKQLLWQAKKCTELE